MTGTLENKEVAPKQTSAMMAYSGGVSGFEDTDATDYAVPLLRILQALSGELKKTDGKFNKDAKVGQIYNIATGELLDGEKGIDVIVGGYSKYYVEWIPKAAGGGIAGTHASDSTVVTTATLTEVDGKNKLLTSTGNELAETAYFSVIVVDEDGNPTPVVIPMSSSALNVARKWNSFMKAQSMKLKVNRAAVVYHLSTKAATNSKGDEWVTWDFSMVRALEENAADMELFQAAVDFGASIKDTDPGHLTEKADRAGGSADGKGEEEF
jgi:hypothetical protein